MNKRHAVTMLLTDAEWGQWSNAEIARRCKVDSSTVDKYRREILPDSGSIKPDRSFTHHKTGTPSTMKTENIGRGRRIEARIGQLLGEAVVGSHHSLTSEGVNIARQDRNVFRRLARGLEVRA